jgi:hypothetical protein
LDAGEIGGGHPGGVYHRATSRIGIERVTDFAAHPDQHRLTVNLGTHRIQATKSRAEGVRLDVVVWPGLHECPGFGHQGGEVVHGERAFLVLGFVGQERDGELDNIAVHFGVLGEPGERRWLVVVFAVEAGVGDGAVAVLARGPEASGHQDALQPESGEGGAKHIGRQDGGAVGGETEGLLLRLGVQLQVIRHIPHQARAIELTIEPGLIPPLDRPFKV